jgi:hypothetical protein
MLIMLQKMPGLISSTTDKLCNSLATYIISILLFKKYCNLIDQSISRQQPVNNLHLSALQQ